MKEKLQIIVDVQKVSITFIYIANSAEAALLF